MSLRIEKTFAQPVIDTELSRIRLQQLVKQKNTGKSCSDLSRLKNNHIATFSRIVYLLSKHYREWDYNQWIQQEHIESVSDLDLCLPHAISYIASEDQTEGAELFIYCSRTIENHLKRLEELGLIKRIKANSKTAILVHPNLLFFTPKYKHLEEKLTSFFANSFELEKTENCPLQEILTKKVLTRYPSLETFQSKLINTEVDNSQIRNFDSSLETIKRNYNAPLETITKETTKTEKPIAKTKETSKLAGENQEITPYEANKRQVEKHINFLWGWMLKNCYTSDKYEFIAKSERRFFFRFMREEFGRSGDQRGLYENMKARLRIWNKFLQECEENNRPFTTPLPSIFFDWTNRSKNGFNITKLYLSTSKKKDKEFELRRKSTNFFRKFREIQENNNLTISEKRAKQQNLKWGMNHHRKEAPELVIAWEEKVSRYLTGDKLIKNYA